MLIFFLASLPFTLFGMLALAVIFYEECDVIRRPAKKETAEERIARYGYDPESVMVKRFQRLAGIKTYYRSSYSTSRESLRDRFNRVRMTCTNTYTRSI